MLHLGVPGIDGPLRARLPGPGPYGPGDAVGVTLVPEAVLVLPDEDDASS